MKPDDRSLRAASSPPTPSAELSRFEELEAYRGVAALAIVVFHAYQHSRVGQSYVYEKLPVHVVLRNLESGVAWFFVLSGFLIFLPFVRSAISQQRPQSARGFLVRRAIRIIPLYYIAILLIWTLRYTGGSEQWLDLFQHLTFTHIFSSKYIFWTIGPAWSLAVEIVFYLLIALLGPLLFWACGKLSGERSRFTLLSAVCAALIVTSLLYKWWAFFVAQIPEERWAVYFGPIAKLDTFAFGMLLAVLLVADRGRPRYTGIGPVLMRIAGLGIMLFAFAYHLSSAGIGLLFHTLSGVGFWLILASTVLGPRGSLWERVLAHPLLQFLGLISYSVYLWHEPILIALSDRRLLTFETPLAFPVNTLLLVSLSVLVGTLSYYALERPSMELRHLFNREGCLAERYTDLHQR